MGEIWWGYMMSVVKNRRKVAWLLVLACGSGAGQVYAAEYGMTLSGGVAYTSNVNQTPVGEPDYYTTVEWGGSYKEVSPRLRLEANGLIQGSFLHRVGTDSLLPQGEVSANAVLSKERLDWDLQDRVNVVRTDILGPDTPSNQELSNVIRTGPNFTARLGKLNRLRVEAKYEQTSFQVSSSKNSIKHIGAVRLVHALSTVSEFSLNFEPSRTFSANGYEEYRTFLGYSRTSPDKLLDAQVGETRILPDSLTGYREPLIDVRGVYRQTARYSWTGTYSQKFSDVGDAILDPLLITDPLLSGLGLFYQKSAGLAFDYKYADLLATVRLGRQYRDYKLTGDWDKTDSVVFDFSRKLRRDSTLGFTASVSDTTYSNPLNNNRSESLSAQYGFLLNRELAWNFGVGYRTRDSVTSSRDFSETLVFTNLELNRLNGRATKP